MGKSPFESTKKTATLSPEDYQALLQDELYCDLSDTGDITSNAVIIEGKKTTADLVMREAGRVCGLDIALAAFSALDKTLSITSFHKDGDNVSADTVIATLSGDARMLLAAERTALNFFAKLCGIATQTAKLVEQVKHYKASIACTRKTTPGLRQLEKYAVSVGGGVPHRFGLYDAILIKDNHIQLAGGVTEAVSRVRRQLGEKQWIEVEVDTLNQLEEALENQVNAVLLDNMTVAELQTAVKLAQHSAVLLEASGGITPSNIADIAKTNVDVISLGWLTHSVRALDVGLDIRC